MTQTPKPNVRVEYARAVDGMVEDKVPGRPPPWGWVENEPPGHPIHLMPTWDIRQHYAIGCPCGAMLAANGRIVHKSFDGRERHENEGAPLH